MDAQLEVHLVLYEAKTWYYVVLITWIYNTIINPLKIMTNHGFWTKLKFVWGWESWCLRDVCPKLAAFPWELLLLCALSVPIAFGNV